MIIIGGYITTAAKPPVKPLLCYHHLPILIHITTYPLSNLPSTPKTSAIMPRNGDGSSDNGPIEGSTIVHGNSGDVRHSPLYPLHTQPLTAPLDHPAARQEQRRTHARDREGRG